MLRGEKVQADRKCSFSLIEYTRGERESWNVGCSVMQLQNLRFHGLVECLQMRTCCWQWSMPYTFSFTLSWPLRRYKVCPFTACLPTLWGTCRGIVMMENTNWVHQDQAKQAPSLLYRDATMHSPHTHTHHCRPLRPDIFCVVCTYWYWN